MSPEEAEAAKKTWKICWITLIYLNELDTTGIEPMSHVFPIENVFREDVVTNGDGSEATLKNDSGAERWRIQSTEDNRRNKNGGHGNEFDEFDSCRAGKKIKAKEVTVEAAVREALDAVRAKEEQVHSFVTVDEEGALVRAKEIQAQIDAGELTGPLAGVPVAIKDNMCTEDC